MGFFDTPQNYQHFDVDKARKDGHSDSDIADHLGQMQKFDVARARGDGYSDQEIIRHLEPQQAFKWDVGRSPENMVELQNYQSTPQNWSRHQDHVPTVGEMASGLTGLPRAAAQYALAVPAAAASIAGQGSGVLAANFDPEHATQHLQAGRERGQRWASNTYGLADYVPATKEGGLMAQGLGSVPGLVIGDLANTAADAVGMSEAAKTTLGEYGSDVLNDLPFLGVKGAVKSGVRTVAKIPGAVRDAMERANPKAPPGTQYDAAGNATGPARMEPPVGQPITGDTLRNQPNPIPPPDGTVAAERQKGTPANPQPAPAAPAPTPPPEPTPAPQAAPEPPPVAPATQDSTPQVAPSTQGMPTGVGAAQGGAADFLGGQRGASLTEDEPLLSGAAGVRLFSAPKDNGAQQTATPEAAPIRQGKLDAVDQLSGGQLPERRTSAVTGDYNATGEDWQRAETGDKVMQKQVASEHNALHTATDNTFRSIGSAFDDSVDKPTREARAGVVRGAIHGIEDHFENAVNDIYNEGRRTFGTKPLQRPQGVGAFLDDRSNYMDPEFRAAAKAKIEQLWTHGDALRDTPPGSVTAAERFREWLNENRTLDNAHVVRALKDHIDVDVAHQVGGPTFQGARALKRHQFQMLEEPKGISKLLQPADSQGINHAIPDDKVMDYIHNLPRQQFEHVMKVLHAGAHLGDGHLAESAAAAIREIQAHAVATLHEAAKGDGGRFKARGFYEAANKVSTNLPSMFKDRPDVVRNLRAINEGANVLHMDTHYPGAVGQAAKSGLAGRAVEAGGHLVASVAHEIPLVGRIIGRHIEAAAERAGGKVSERGGERATQKRLTDRYGNQRGSVNFFEGSDEDSPAARMISHFNNVSQEHKDQIGTRAFNGASVSLARDPFDPNTVHIESIRADQGRQGAGNAAMKGLTALADKHGTRLTLDSVPMKANPGETAIPKDKLGAFYKSHGFEPTEGGLVEGSAMERRARGGMAKPTEAQLRTASGIPEPTASTARHPAFQGGEQAPRGEAPGRPLGRQAGRITLFDKSKRGDKVGDDTPLRGAPGIDTPNAVARASAEKYQEKTGYGSALEDYRYQVPEASTKVADAYEKMEHNPNSKRVKASYDQFKDEIVDQYNHMIKSTGLTHDMRGGQDYPYKNPRDVMNDVRDNNHLTTYPTEGNGSEFEAGHPMFEDSPVINQETGKPFKYNDLFRAVHDYYGHVQHGNGFRDNGEYNAWRSHREMFSPLARGAMDTETLGQNSWVNYGPHGEANRVAGQGETVYPPQKAGLLPKSVTDRAAKGISPEESTQSPQYKQVAQHLTAQEKADLEDREPHHRANAINNLLDMWHGSTSVEGSAAMALAGQAKKGWYKQSGHAINTVYGKDAPRFTALLAALSPQTSVEMNFRNAIHVFKAWDEAGRQTDHATITKIMEENSLKNPESESESNIMEAWRQNAIRALTSDDPAAEHFQLSGPKVDSFFRNLRGAVNEVTNDSWQAIGMHVPQEVFGGVRRPVEGDVFGQRGFKSPGYMGASAKARAGAKFLTNLTGESWTPDEFQETMWSFVKTAMEYNETMAKRAKEAGLPKPAEKTVPQLIHEGLINDDLIRSTPDFAQLFAAGEHAGVFATGRFAEGAQRLAKESVSRPEPTGPSEASKAAAATLHPALLEQAHRLEGIRQQRIADKAAGKKKPTRIGNIEVPF